jgi:hypothetical protein
MVISCLEKGPIEKSCHQSNLVLFWLFPSFGSDASKSRGMSPVIYAERASWNQRHLWLQRTGLHSFFCTDTGKVFPNTYGGDRSPALWMHFEHNRKYAESQNDQKKNESSPNKK